MKQTVLSSPLRARLRSARRRAAVVTSAALLATGLSASGCSTADAPSPTVSVEAEAPPATLLPPPILLASDLEAPPNPVADETEAPSESASEVIGSGRASYYGAELAGNPTASGETFDPSKMTAAHRTLPFGTRLRVTNERTGASVVVRVNDRGPFHGNRVLDVSTAAAEEIGLKRAGTARVTMERVGVRG